MKIHREYQSLQHFITVLRKKGYDVDQAQEDIERWAQFYQQDPTHPGWYREAEIRRLQKRDAELEKAKRREQERGH